MRLNGRAELVQSNSASLPHPSWAATAERPVLPAIVQIKSAGGSYMQVPTPRDRNLRGHAAALISHWRLQTSIWVIAPCIA